jgi:hypothetical protein
MLWCQHCRYVLNEAQFLYVGLFYFEYYGVSFHTFYFDDFIMYLPVCIYLFLVILLLTRVTKKDGHQLVIIN